ncbi:MAG: GNAT family N-acetyltransferase, partial [Chloroflexi bacterium]|nr:GNAT family N-acetyltransferase [Chloroflexota bacterium]
DKSRLDFTMIHDFLAHRSYWALGVSLESIQTAAQNSLTFGVYHGDRQVGYARIITDTITIAYLLDVFILEEYRGRGLSKALVEYILDHPALQRVRRFFLSTRDAHTLYSRYGFQCVTDPENWMFYRPARTNPPATAAPSAAQPTTP